MSCETIWPIKAKFHVEPPKEGKTKLCINGLAHMAKMAALPVYGKNHGNLLLQNKKSEDLETLLKHAWLHVIYCNFSRL